MTRSLLVSGAVMSLVCLAPQALANPPGLPPLPGGDKADNGDPTAAPSQAPAPANQASQPQQLYERVRRGVVSIQASQASAAAGHSAPVALGTVLWGDGRILTSWSGLGGAQQADVRYADGTTVHAKVERTDKTLDLALLAPDPVHSKDGLTASEADPSGIDVRAMLPANGAFLGPALAAFRGPADAHGKSGEPLLKMLNVDVQGVPVAGAPLLDPAGAVVAVLVRGCRGLATSDADKKTCQPVVLGAPVSAIRSFLVPAPPAAAARVQDTPAPAPAPAPALPPAAAPVPHVPSPFLGIRVEPQVSGAVHGVRVAAVAPGGPAEQAGLKPSGDIIVAVDGQPVTASDSLAAIIGKHAPGDTVQLLVFGAGAFRQVAVTLRDAQ
ncbi:MAG: PDZ domain-containing protein [Polyangiaceae bacterium]|nr:PDZ domain-containing protein [Polyangiaceae bacterium]